MIIFKFNLEILCGVRDLLCKVDLAKIAALMLQKTQKEQIQNQSDRKKNYKSLQNKEDRERKLTFAGFTHTLLFYQKRKRFYIYNFFL